MVRERAHWRIRISTLMLLVVIAALSLALVVEHRKRMLSEELARANEQQARVEAERARDLAQQARAQRAAARVRAVEDQTKSLDSPAPR